MPTCDMCGKEKELYKAMVEGVELSVCEKCGKHGNILGRAKERDLIEGDKRDYATVDEPKIIERLVSSYEKKIKEKRENLGLKQEEFAKALNEKVSLIHNIESGKFRPGPELAKKIGQFLKIELIERYEEKRYDPGQKKDLGELTLGDFIKIKSKKKE